MTVKKKPNFKKNAAPNFGVKMINSLPAPTQLSK